MGLLAFARPAARPDLELATERFRQFREQPTPELARSAGAGLRAAVSPNDRLQQLYHPWTSYVIVPLFALANAGIAIDRDFLEQASTSPITLGILFGYALGKPLGIVGATWINTRLSGGRLRLPVGWGALAGAGTIAGIGFTVALLVAELAFDGERARRGEGGHPQLGTRRRGGDLASLPRRRAAAEAHTAAGAARNRRAAHRPRGRGLGGSRPHPRAA